MSPAASLTAMVVEDHDFQRHTVARMLRALGVPEVAEARDGREALAKLQAMQQIDLVVCDLDMPEMDGMEFLRHLGEAHSMASVVICSAQDKTLLSSVEKMAHAYGVMLLGAIEKPVTLGGLETLIARRLTGPTLQGAEDRAAPYSFDQIIEGLRLRQFEAFFQPKVDLESGLIVGAEALARWRHPDDGIVAPATFIPTLEQNRQLDTLTLDMLDAAARACLDWRMLGFDLTVSVNLSLVSLGNTSLADRITRCVQSVGLDPHHVVLEITETAAMTEVAPALENLTRLRMRGFGLSVDDYGTGFSSLRQLTRVPFTELKIDQAFVTGVSGNPSSRTIVESSVEMASRLGIQSVAEGVEAREDLDLLKILGCEIAQGYYIARPLESRAFARFIESTPAARIVAND